MSPIKSLLNSTSTMCSNTHRKKKHKNDEIHTHAPLAAIWSPERDGHNQPANAHQHARRDRFGSVWCVEKNLVFFFRFRLRLRTRARAAPSQLKSQARVLGSTLGAILKCALRRHSRAVVTAPRLRRGWNRRGGGA